VSDDGLRLWINGAAVIDNWTDHSPTTDTSAGVNLVAGQRVTIQLEYYERTGDATMQLRWVTPGNATAAAIPASAMAPQAVASNGLAASYFNNTTLGGTAVLTRTEAVDFDWGTGSPGAGVSADNFSVRWSGSLIVPTSGKYSFQTASDDGVRLWINGVQLVNNWNDHGPTTNTTNTVSLSAGQRVSVRMEYYDRTGGATARLRWQLPRTSGYVAVPATSLSPN
jgi:MSHA biogenesis protein MshQ